MTKIILASLISIAMTLTAAANEPVQWPLKAIEYPAGAGVCTASGICTVATVPFVVMPKTQAVRIANALPEYQQTQWYEKPEIWLAAGALVAAIFGVVLEVK